jgi:hypothetical protein
LIPPFFFFASLLLGAWAAGKDLPTLLERNGLKEVLGLFAAGAVAVLPLGFLSGTISITILGLLARLCGWATYEAFADQETQKRLSKHIHAPAVIQKPHLILYTVATFDHEVLHPGVHTWIMRRWNAFNVCVSCCVALGGAQAVGRWLLGLPETATWLWLTVVAVVVFGVTSLQAWRHVMKMIEFQSHRSFERVDSHT